MPDPKKKQTKATAARKKPTQTGYGPQNRPGTFAKKKKLTLAEAKKKAKKKGIKKKTVRPPVGERERLRMIAREKARKALLKKARMQKMKRPIVKPKKVTRKTNRTYNRY
tara:strand:- start:174 stop:503 length:330 start_codon:yes stop_codon:yes gene_type:complete